MNNSFFFVLLIAVKKIENEKTKRTEILKLHYLRLLMLADQGPLVLYRFRFGVAFCSSCETTALSTLAIHCMLVSRLVKKLFLLTREKNKMNQIEQKKLYLTKLEFFGSYFITLKIYSVPLIVFIPSPMKLQLYLYQ